MSALTRGRDEGGHPSLTARIFAQSMRSCRGVVVHALSRNNRFFGESGDVDDDDDDDVEQSSWKDIPRPLSGYSSDVDYLIASRVAMVTAQRAATLRVSSLASGTNVNRAAPHSGGGKESFAPGVTLVTLGLLPADDESSHTRAPHSMTPLFPGANLSDPARLQNDTETPALLGSAIFDGTPPEQPLWTPGKCGVTGAERAARALTGATRRAESLKCDLQETDALAAKPSSGHFQE